MENRKKKNNGENSGPLTSLPVNRLTATDCNGDRSCQLTLSALGGRRSLYSLGGGQFDRHILTAPGGLLGHKSSNFNHYTV